MQKKMLYTLPTCVHVVDMCTCSVACTQKLISKKRFLEIFVLCVNFLYYDTILNICSNIPDRFLFEYIHTATYEIALRSDCKLGNKARQAVPR